MRDKLIKIIVRMSTEVYDDDLSWMDFNQYSNDELLFMFARISVDEYLMHQVKGTKPNEEYN